MKNNIKMQARMAPEGGRAIVSLAGEIGRWGFSPESWAAVETWCQDNAATRITLRINSPGGSLPDAMAIVDLMRASKIELEAEIFGLCASAATLVALACKRVRMSPHSQFMVHQPYGVIAGSLADMEAGLDIFKQLRQQAFDMYAAKTGKPADAIMADHEHDVWYTAQQAVDYGFVDEIIGAADDADQPEDNTPEPADDTPEPAEMYAQRGLLNSAAVAKILSWCGMRTPAKKAEDNRIAELSKQIGDLKAEMTALKAERDGAAENARRAEEEAQAMEARIAERVAKAIAADRASLAVNPSELPPPQPSLTSKNSALAGKSVDELLQIARAEREDR